MRSSHDKVLDTERKQRHGADRVLGTLLKPKMADKRVRSITYRLTVAGLPNAKKLAEFDFLAG